MENQPLQVGEALALVNQVLDNAFPVLMVEGEVTGFKVSQGKFVFFDIKDVEGSLGCFMMAFALNMALEDGMKVRVVAQPKLTKWGKFSLTVRSVQPIGEGSIRRNFELQKAKLAKEGLFAPEAKRRLPTYPQHIAVISSVDAAGYADFVKIAQQRWPGLAITVYNVPVQGESAPRHIVRALELANLAAETEAIAVVRGGGAREDLAAFDDEAVVRAIAGSRTPVITGVGHEIDETLADLAADARASTPSNASELLLPEKREVLIQVEYLRQKPMQVMERLVLEARRTTQQARQQFAERFARAVDGYRRDFVLLSQVARQYDPRVVLARGYALARSPDGVLQKKPPRVGDTIEIETATYQATTEVKHVKTNG